MIPPGVTSLADYERLAAERLPSATWTHIQDGAGSADAEALRRIRLVPRMLTDLRGGSTAIELFGQRHPSPILLAPIAYQRLAHPDGEAAVVRAAAALGVTTVVGTLASVPLETLATLSADAGRELSHPPPPLWFQLYMQPTREETLALVRRAEAAGYAALVVTVDAALKRSGFALPPGVEAANLPEAARRRQVEEIRAGGATLFGSALVAQAPRWADIAWLRGETRLPLILKGILSPDDARSAIEHGVDGLVVSNHGGRILHCTPAALDALPAIAEVVGGRVPLLVDGGIRSGEDVAKALAVGARGVLVGRPQMHALAVGGTAGVAHMLHLLRSEFELVMAQLGCAQVAEIGPRLLFRGR